MWLHGMVGLAAVRPRNMLFSNEIPCSDKVSQQCASTYGKANKMMGIINSTVNYKSTEVMLRLCKSVVRRHLQYCHALLFGVHITPRTKNWLKKLQRRFTRMIPDIKDLPYLERLHRLNLWTLEERRIRSDLIVVYKVINGLADVKLEAILNSTLTHALEVVLTDWKKRKAFRKIYDSVSLLQWLSTSGTVRMSRQYRLQH